MNVALGSGALAGCVGVCGWIVARVAGAYLEVASLAYAVPVSVLAGVASGAAALLRFTGEHRDWLYRGELLEDEPPSPSATRAPRPGVPPPGVLIRGIDGAYHRIDVDLTEGELHAVKASMLSGGAFTVRAVNTLLGDDSRASTLRGELHRLGILEAPRDRAACRLTEPGRRAVLRWQ